MTGVNPFTRWTERSAEEALERSLERLAHDSTRTGSLVAAREPAHAFELRPLLEVAIDLREAFGAETPSSAAREDLMAVIRRTPQERPTPRGRAVLRSVPSLPHGWALFVNGGVRRGIGAVALAAFVGVAVLLTGPGQAVTPAAAATLTVVSGSVERLRGEAPGTVIDGAPVFEGDTLRLGPDAVAILTFVDGSTVQLSGGAELTVSRARFEASPAIRVEQRAGQVIADLPPDAEAGTSLKVEAPGAVIEVHSGGFAADVSADGTLVQAFEQSVVVNNDTHAREVVDPGASKLIGPPVRRHESPSPSHTPPSTPPRSEAAPEESSRGRGVQGGSTGKPVATPRESDASMGVRTHGTARAPQQRPTEPSRSGERAR